MASTNLRPQDYLIISGILMIQVFLLLIINLTLLQWTASIIIQILAATGFKLFNMYRMDPQERVAKKREDGLAGLMC